MKTNNVAAEVFCMFLFLLLLAGMANAAEIYDFNPDWMFLRSDHQLAPKEYREHKSIWAGAKAATLMAALELGWRMHSEAGNNTENIITDSKSLYNYMLPTLADLDHEEFWAVFMNNRNKVLGRQRISVGGQTDTGVDARILFRAALDAKATTIAVAHNHPSGTLKPSVSDRNLTRRLNEAGNLLGIKLAEHIIVAIGPKGVPDYYSFHDEGML